MPLIPQIIFQITLKGLRSNDYLFPISWISHHAEIRVKDINLDLSMSTVIGLGDLAEDEVISPPMPVTVSAIFLLQKTSLIINYKFPSPGECRKRSHKLAGGPSTC